MFYHQILHESAIDLISILEQTNTVNTFQTYKDQKKLWLKTLVKNKQTSIRLL